MPKEHSRHSIRHFWDFLVGFEGRFSREDYWLGGVCHFSMLG
jgi:uncharacterized membrane protein YhaH (DUF805 family)